MNHSKDMSRKLPEFIIGETVFTVDARKHEFREKKAPWNKIPIGDFLEDAPTTILFDKQLQNDRNHLLSGDERSAHVELITVPPIVELDPIGLGRHYHLDDDVFKKTVVVNLKTPYREQLAQNTQKHRKGRGIK